MNTWFKLLPLEIQAVEELVEPTDEVKEGETIVGTVPDELKRLWSLHKSMKKAAEMMEIELRYTKGSAQDRGKVCELMGKAKALEIIFWTGVLDEWQLWGHPEQTALRVGWQVVEFKKPELPFPFKFFPGG